MFRTLQSVSSDELADLKGNNADYRALLETSYGQAFEDKIGNSTIIKVYAQAISSESSPSSSTRTSSSGTGIDCLESGETADDVSEKIDVLNCLVFDTDQSFWETQAMRTQQNNDLATTPRYDFLGLGDWECSRVPDEPFLASCLEHDVSYSSLKGFVRNFFLKDEGFDFNRDASWHPRNKTLADIVLLRELLDDASRITTQSCDTLLPSGWDGTLRNSRDTEAILAFYTCSIANPPATITSRLEAAARGSLMFLGVSLASPPDWWLESIFEWLDIQRNYRFVER